MTVKRSDEAGSTVAGTDSAAIPSAQGAATDRVLDLVWRRQRQWSRAANATRARLDRWRFWNRLLLVLGALAGASAAQNWRASGVVTGFAIAAAVALALAGLIQANALNEDQTARWTQARAASEALKAEVYRYLIRVSPYAGADPALALKAQLDIVQDRVPQALLADQQMTAADERPVPSSRTFGQYVTLRAQDQADWHRTKSAEHAGQARTLRVWQLIATGVGVVLSAIAAFVPSWHLSAWTAAATTIAAAVGAHLAATQHQRIAAAYAATADQLERLIVSIDPATATPEQQAQFVADVERILAAQNGAWTDLLSTKPTPLGKTELPRTRNSHARSADPEPRPKNHRIAPDDRSRIPVGRAKAPRKRSPGSPPRLAMVETQERSTGTSATSQDVRCPL
jgi:hypothetical protein